MKRIIEISDEVYENLSKGYWSKVEFCDLANVIANSISFNEVIEERKLKENPDEFEKVDDWKDCIDPRHIISILEQNKENEEKNG